MKSQSTKSSDEGMIVGAAGGAAVAFWFFVVDLMAGAPMRTPNALGQVILLGNPHPSLTSIDYTALIIYSAFHFGVFISLGILLATLAREAEHNSVVRYAILMIFVAFEVVVAGVLSAFSEQTGALFPVWQVVGGNTLAVVVMALALWRFHPRIREALQETPLGAAPGK